MRELTVSSLPGYQKTSKASAAKSGDTADHSEGERDQELTENSGIVSKSNLYGKRAR